ncbi:MAG: TIGR02391 family protein [Candidatus Melainabacteria bacterium]|nr:TIGR02391 family protein [Candidatus Melainabacteria bacterium]
MTTIPSIDPTYVTMICDAFVALEDVISDGELGALILSSGIQDLHHNASRHRRLSSALISDQDHHRCANNLASFLKRTGLHIKKSRGENTFRRYINQINEVLSFSGYELGGEDAQIKLLDRSKTTYVSPEAEDRVRRFRENIAQNHLHPDIQMVCRAEYFVESGFFRPVKEAMRLLIEKIRTKAVLPQDGPELAEHAFAFAWPNRPVLAINTFLTEKDLAEQFSFMVLLKAFFLMFQDEQTRSYRPSWDMSLEDAIQLLSLASYFHRKVDKAMKTVPAASNT